MVATAPRIEVRNLTKSFRREGGDIVRPVDNISMIVSEDELVVLLGPSGCGKTTLLRCVAGLERPDEGEILIDGRVVFSAAKGIMLPPEQRGISMIFQAFALWPHMTVFDNVAYPLRSKKVPARDIPGRVNEILEIAGVGGLGGQYPGRISGGQQQRVALARALVSGSSVVLFDEPLSNVDTQVRARLRLELRKLHRQIKFSALYVTHDQVEALELGHRVAVLDRGRIADLGTPRRVYERPASEYVANFVGVANLFDVRIDGVDGEGFAVSGAVGSMTAAANPASLDWNVGDRALAVVRPENLRLVRGASRPGVNSIAGKVEAVVFAGPHTEVLVNAGDTLLRSWSNTSELDGLEEGAEVTIAIPPEAVHLVRPTAEASRS
jgi:ABC-type Fe3+/spermidine/putrescine transport system ATPase subunit